MKNEPTIAKATLTEYLEKNVEKLALLRFSFGETAMAPS